MGRWMKRLGEMVQSRWQQVVVASETQMQKMRYRGERGGMRTRGKEADGENSARKGKVGRRKATEKETDEKRERTEERLASPPFHSRSAHPPQTHSLHATMTLSIPNLPIYFPPLNLLNARLSRRVEEYGNGGQKEREKRQAEWKTRRLRQNGGKKTDGERDGEETEKERNQRREPARAERRVEMEAERETHGESRGWTGMREALEER